MSVALIRGYDNRYALIDLWGQAFGDESDFVSDMYACGYLKPSDIFALTVDGRLAAALFLPEYRICVGGEDLPIRLLSCVATDPAQQGRGYMSLLISRALSLVRGDCCGVCVIPVSEKLYSFYEKIGFKTAFYYSETCAEPGEPLAADLPKAPLKSMDAYYDEYLKKYRKDGWVYKTKDRFLQAVTEYTHPTQPCEFLTYSTGCAFLQKSPSEIVVREWTGVESDLKAALFSHYHLPLKIQHPNLEGEKKTIGMLYAFSDALANLSSRTDLYLNCMYN